MRQLLKSRRYLVIVLAALLTPATVLAAEAPAPQPTSMEKLLQELRSLDTSTDMQGDHVVGGSRPTERAN